MQAKTLLNTMVLAILSFYSVAATGGEILYVDSAAIGANNGTSWADAFMHPQDALAASSSGDEIWVAEGVYKPDRGGGQTLGDRTASFHLINGVSIYGGFPQGGGTWDDRSVEHGTILSGDLNADDAESYATVRDAWNSGKRRDNSYHVVTAALCGPHTVVDLVTIVRGNANESEQARGSGGGLYNDNNASPTFQNCVFRLNSARGNGYTAGGGAVVNTQANSKPTFVGCVFENNFAQYGGAALNRNGGAPTFVESSFDNNRAYYHGGAMYSYPGSPTIRGCTFTSNSSSNYSGGAMYSFSSTSTITGCTFEKNSAKSRGGAMYNEKSTAVVEDSMFLENASDDSGGAIMNFENDDAVIQRCLFYANAAGDDGGAVYLRLPIAGAAIEKCTFMGNRARRYGGALRLGERAVIVDNCTFSSNYTQGGSSYGGAVYLYSGSATLLNCTLWDNVTNVEGGGVYCGPRAVDMHNCVLWENRDNGGVQADASGQAHGSNVTMTYCCVQGLDSASLSHGNISADPRLVDPLGPDWLPGTLDDDLRLALDSPCIDAGDNESVPEGVITDIRGANRFTDYPHAADTGHGMTPIVDMGSSEVCPLRWWALDNPAIHPQVVQDWLDLGQPGCWCAPYQCDGDTDQNVSSSPFFYRVFTGDLNLLLDNWKKKIDDPTFNPCADIDHRSSGIPFHYRVFTKDLNILVSNWRKKDANLGGDCPRP